MSEFVSNPDQAPADRQTRSLEQAKAWFRAEGISVRAWAKSQGFGSGEVYALLNGRTRGYRGNSHRVAVALQVKQPATHEASAGADIQPLCKGAAHSG